MKLRPSLLLLCLGVLVAGAAPRPAARAEAPAPAASPAREAAWRENNLGVALLEQFRFGDAAGAFGRALEKDPSLLPARINLAIALLYVPDIPAAKQAAEVALKAAPDAPQPNYILALIARSEGRAEDALPYVRKVLEKDPKDLGANVTLGQVYLQTRQFEDAAVAFRIALAAEPYNVSAAYNLGVALTRAGKREEGQQAMAAFQKLRDSAYKSALGSNYLEQGKYAEALASTGAEPEAVDAKTPAVSFAGKDEALAGASTLVLADIDGDGALDAVTAGRGGLRALRGEAGRLADATEKAGLSGIAASAAVAGDYDNDGRPDLLASAPGGLSLLHNEGGGRFKAEAAPVPGVAARRGHRRLRRHRPRRRPRRLRGRGRTRRGRPAAPEQRRPHLHRHHGERAARRRRRGGGGGPDRLRQPARHRPLRPEARPAGPAQEHAGRHVQGPGGRAGPRGHGAVHLRRRR